MPPKPVLASAAAAAVLACAAPAPAAVTFYTYTGTVSTMYDQTGVFGGVDLTGRAFTAVFRRDDAGPATEFQSSEQSFFQTYEGSSALRATLKIQGLPTITFGETSGYQYQYQSVWAEQVNHGADNYTFEDDGIRQVVASRTLAFDIYGEGAHLLPSADFRSLQSLSVETFPYYWGGTMMINNFVYDYGSQSYLNYQFANLQFAPTSLTVSTAAPEPGAWALMLAGFFGAGAALRRRRRALA
jgi:hypothetical protein